MSILFIGPCHQPSERHISTAAAMVILLVAGLVATHTGYATDDNVG